MGVATPARHRAATRGPPRGSVTARRSELKPRCAPRVSLAARAATWRRRSVPQALRGRRNCAPCTRWRARTPPTTRRRHRGLLGRGCEVAEPEPREVVARGVLLRRWRWHEPSCPADGLATLATMAAKGKSTKKTMIWRQVLEDWNARAKPEGYTYVAEVDGGWLVSVWAGTDKPPRRRSTAASSASCSWSPT